MASSTKGAAQKDTLSPSEWVYAYRKARGWTQAQAAKWWGCSEREWRRYETPGDTPPPAPLLKRIKAFRGWPR